MESNKNEKPYYRKLQVNDHMTFKDFKNLLAKIINRMPQFTISIDSKSIRIWRVNPDTKLYDLHQYLVDCCKKSKSYDYLIQMKGVLVELDPSTPISELDEEELFVLEIMEPMKNCIFYNDQVKMAKKCQDNTKLDQKNK